MPQFCSVRLALAAAALALTPVLPAAAASPQPPTYAMFVSSLNPGYRTMAGGSYQVYALITIKDTSGASVRGAVVTITLYPPTGDALLLSASTNSQGVARVAFSTGSAGVYSLSVADVTHSSGFWSYLPELNVELSDSITIPAQ